MKQFFVAATRQNDGKTVTALGLIKAFQKRVKKVGYIKPVGQRYEEVDGHKIDEDAILVKEACGLDIDLASMSPIAVPRGFTEDYILRGDRQALLDQVTTAYRCASEGAEMMVVEGTGHAGVGSVFDLNNADVAKLLGCPVVLVSAGGIGKPIDEILLNKAMFDQAGVELLGVIINRVQEEKFDKINDLVRKGLERKGIRTLGVMPFRPILSHPTVEQLVEDIQGEVLSGRRGLTNPVERVVIGAMSPHDALNYFGKGVLLITPGSREDLILAALSSCLVGIGRQSCVSGIILTAGVAPHPNIMALIRRTFVPVIMSDDDTFTTVSKVDHFITKVRPGDTDKIRMSEEMIETYVDVDSIAKALKEASHG
ncbi:MAG: AAA family ATPase [Armatimonadetes bacterium]|nr:AAA family ATPase [Armatimonadota bacterium]